MIWSVCKGIFGYIIPKHNICNNYRLDDSGVFRYFQKNTSFEVFLDAFCRGVSDILMKICNFVNACEQWENKGKYNFHTKITRFWKAFTKSIGALVNISFKKHVFVLFIKCKC